MDNYTKELQIKLRMYIKLAERNMKENKKLREENEVLRKKVKAGIIEKGILEVDNK